MGFIADDLSNHLIADIATGAEGALRAHGYSLLVMNSELDPSLDPVNIRVLKWGSFQKSLTIMKPRAKNSNTYIKKMVERIQHAVGIRSAS